MFEQTKNARYFRPKIWSVFFKQFSFIVVANDITHTLSVIRQFISYKISTHSYHVGPTIFRRQYYFLRGVCADGSIFPSVDEKNLCTIYFWHIKEFTMKIKRHVLQTRQESHNRLRTGKVHSFKMI